MTIPAPVRLLATSLLAACALAFAACDDAGEDLGFEETSTATGAASTATSLPAQQAPTGTPPQTAPPPSSTTGATVTYTDPAYGYSFAYPSSWYLSTPAETGGDLVLRSYDPATAPGIGGPIPKDKLKARFWVAEGVTKPLADWLAEGDASAGQFSTSVVVSQTEVTVAAKQGIRRVTDVGHGITHISYYLLMGGGRVFVVNGGRADSELWPDLEVIILASLRFAP
ncbi:MAG: hypothetical protein WED85_13655 [Dehalococcoidia bacterium]